MGLHLFSIGREGELPDQQSLRSPVAER